MFNSSYSKKTTALTIGFILLLGFAVNAQNPLIRDQFTADPSAVVFGDSVYIYPSHDILANKDRGRPGWFCMEDYHVFSSADLTDWKDHGVIVTQNKVPWVKPDSYSMWAPDCTERNGKYYFYFPSTPKDTTLGKGFTIGVAIADKPTGPFIPQTNPIKGVKGIDPNVFIDKDGQAYLYWSQGNIYAAKLKENMLELASEPVILQDLPTKGLKEGPYLFERNGHYYLTYPHVENKTERLEYAMGDNPLGPFKVTGVIMDETPGCWTNHHSIIPFKKQWYLFYHANDFSPDFDKARSIRADSLFFNTDGTIIKVKPTLRGVGASTANKQIEVDRYSQISDNTQISFIDTANKFKGWDATLGQQNAWIKYNKVDFKNENWNKITWKVTAPASAKVEVRLGNEKGKLLSVLTLNETSDYNKTVDSNLMEIPSGIHDLIFISKSNLPIKVDWIKFEK